MAALAPCYPTSARHTGDKWASQSTRHVTREISGRVNQPWYFREPANTRYLCGGESWRAVRVLTWSYISPNLKNAFPLFYNKKAYQPVRQFIEFILPRQKTH